MRKVLKQFKIILLLSIIVITVYSVFPLQDKNLTWTSINVSNSIQGDAHLISKGDIHFLIDTGSHIEAKNYLINYLKEKKITHIDGILITHPHFDHYGGVITILENNITVDKIYMNMPTKAQMHREWWGGEYKHLMHIKNYCKTHQIPFISITQNMKLIFDKKSYIKVLYIYDGIHTPVGHTDINDMSAITMVVDDKNKFLLTGDLNKKLGTYLASNSHSIKADILKAPHHGGKSLAPDSFFKAVAPKVLIVPTTQNLWCSDRCKDVRELSKNENYRTYINGIHGHITVTSYNNEYIISTEKSPKEICKEGQ